MEGNITVTEIAGLFTATILDLVHLDLKQMEQCPAGSMSSSKVAVGSWARYLLNYLIHTNIALELQLNGMCCVLIIAYNGYTVILLKIIRNPGSP